MTSRSSRRLIPRKAFPAPIGISSMKRTSTGSSLVSATKSRISSSFSPRMGTQLIFMGIPRAAPSFTASKTCFHISLPSVQRPAIPEKRSGFKVSRLTLIPSMDRRFSSGNALLRSTPLVVRVTASVSGSSLSLRISSRQSCRTSGSPPVILNLWIPIRSAAWQTRRTSSRFRYLS